MKIFDTNTETETDTRKSHDTETDTETFTAQENEISTETHIETLQFEKWILRLRLRPRDVKNRYRY